MRKLRSGLVALVAAWTISGCIPESPAPSATIPDPSRSTALCDRLGGVYGELAAVNDAFRLVIGNDLDGAVTQARLIRSRLDDLVVDLPVPITVGEPGVAISEAIVDRARLVDLAAGIIDTPADAGVDREVVLAGGETVLDLIDRPLPWGTADDPMVTACPRVAYSVAPVNFPPPPTNASLGLPEVVGDWTLRTHVQSEASLSRSALRSVGVEPTAVREIDVQVTDLDGAIRQIDVIDRVEVAPAEVADAVRQAFLPEATASTSEKMAGFELFTYRFPDEPSMWIHVAARGDRVMIFHDFADQDVRQVLAAMP